MTERRPTVVVCGAGMAGLTAGVAALERGAEVILLEKAGQIGGTTALSGGLVWTFADLAEMEAAVPFGNPVLQALVHGQLADGRRWLGGHGVVFRPEESAFGYGWGQRMDPDQALDRLHAAFERLGGTIVYETALDALRRRDGRVVGVDTIDGSGAGGRRDCDAVVLATGGFQGNPELLRRYVVPPTNLHLRASSWSTGDGLVAAMGIGAAATSGLDTFYGHALPASPSRYRPLEFRDASQIYGAKSIALNLDGRRFADESTGTGEEDLNQELARQREGRGFYVIDRAIAEEESRPGRRLARVVVEWSRDHGAAVVIADTIEGLAEELGRHGLPPAIAENTLREFNTACETGTTAQLSPPRTGNRRPLREPPFFAVGVQAAITFTMGGLAIDERARVLRRSASSSPIAQSITELSEFREVPIHGLYAAGCDVGNVSHRGYVGGLATALTTGRIAGHEAATYRP